MNTVNIDTQELYIVTDLISDRKILYVGNTQREKVIAAYAQSLGDYNTWGYSKYDHMVVWGKYTVAVGNFTAWRNSSDSDDNKNIPCLVMTY